MNAAFIKSGSRVIALCYTARRAAALEADINASLPEGLAQCNKVGTLCKYIQHGAGLTSDEAYDIYDDCIANGVTHADLVEAVVDGLAESGFIEKKLVDNAKKLKNQLQNAQVS